MPVISSLVLHNGKTLRLDDSWPGADDALDIKVAAILHQPSSSVEQEVSEEPDEVDSGVETVKQNYRGRYIIVSSSVIDGRFLSMRLWEDLVAFEEVLFTGTEINELFEVLSDPGPSSTVPEDESTAPAPA